MTLSKRGPMLGDGGEKSLKRGRNRLDEGFRREEDADDRDRRAPQEPAERVPGEAGAQRHDVGPESSGPRLRGDDRDAGRRGAPEESGQEAARARLGGQDHGHARLGGGLDADRGRRDDGPRDAGGVVPEGDRPGGGDDRTVSDDEVERFVRDNEQYLRSVARKYGRDPDEVEQEARCRWWYFRRERREARCPRRYVLASVRNAVHDSWKREAVHSPIRRRLGDRLSCEERAALRDRARYDVGLTVLDGLPSRSISPADFVDEDALGVRVEDESTWPEPRSRSRRR